MSIIANNLTLLKTSKFNMNQSGLLKNSSLNILHVSQNTLIRVIFIKNFL